MSAPLLQLPHLVRRGDRDEALVRVVQEWLCLNLRYPWPTNLLDKVPVCPIDGVFGDATEAAVREYQRGRGEQDTGEVDYFGFAHLTEPMRLALTIPSRRETLGGTIVAVASRHFMSHPREVGGQNRGPWVRLYMGGEGENYLWCAGFASYCVKQAAELMRMSVPFRGQESCDQLAADAHAAGTFLAGTDDGPPKGLHPGALFLVRSKPGADRKYHHAGIVELVEPTRCVTIEGNTNDGGSSNGYGVFARARGYAGLDFVVIDGAA